jgi:(R,R)-butanediol dehydrogenase/meso-butanediol dehydrogenase/diacetyl reductase
MEMGATGFLVDRDDPVGAAERALGGKADIVFECVGVPGLIAQAVDQVRVKGTVLVLGLCTRPDTFVPFTALSKEVRIQTSAFFTTQEYQASLDVLERGAAEPRALVTDTIALADVPERFEALRHRTHDCKVLISPGI